MPDAAAQFGCAAEHEPTTNSVPPRVMSRLPLACEVKAAPRRPASTVPFVIAPLAANAFSLATEIFIVIVLLVVSNAPQSALPRDVLESEPSEFRTAVPKVNVGAAMLSVLA